MLCVCAPADVELTLHVQLHQQIREVASLKKPQGTCLVEPRHKPPPKPPTQNLKHLPVYSSAHRRQKTGDGTHLMQPHKCVFRPPGGCKGNARRQQTQTLHPPTPQFNSSHKATASSALWSLRLPTICSFSKNMLIAINSK